MGSEMIVNMVGPFTVNAPFGTEIAFKKGLEQAGITVCSWDPNLPEGPFDRLSDIADATIVFKSCVGRENELMSFKLSTTRPYILYQPDDMRFPHIRQMAVDMRKLCDHFLSFDDESARIAEAMGYMNCRKMLVTADPDVYHSGDLLDDRPIDVCMVASLGDPAAHASRRRIAQIARDYGKKKGWRVEIHDGIRDPEQIRRLYCRSKVVINHATDVGQPFGLGYGLQCRHFEVALTRTCLLSNRLCGVPLDLHPPFEVFEDEKDFTSKMRWLVENESIRRDYADDLFSWIMIGHLPIHRGMDLKKYIKDIS